MAFITCVIAVRDFALSCGGGLLKYQGDAVGEEHWCGVRSGRCEPGVANQGGTGAEFGGFRADGVVHGCGFGAHEAGRLEDAEFLVGAFGHGHQDFDRVRVAGVVESFLV